MRADGYFGKKTNKTKHYEMSSNPTLLEKEGKREIPTMTFGVPT